jgi:hypothetical protein
MCDSVCSRPQLRNDEELILHRPRMDRAVQVARAIIIAVDSGCGRRKIPAKQDG